MEGKGGSNTIRRNVVFRCSGAEAMSNRSGSNNLFENNLLFENTLAWEIYSGTNNTWRNNIVLNCQMIARIKGTAIVYSAAPGQTAQDGPKGGHGVFTGALLAVLDRPGLTLEQVFKETAKRVALATNGKQDPWINSSVKGDFIFNPGAVPVALNHPFQHLNTPDESGARAVS